MASDALPEPWRSFLGAIDLAATAPIELHCIGGFAVSVHYGLSRPTGDIDVVEVKPSSQKEWLGKIAGEGSRLHKKHKIYLQIVTVATVPYGYEERLVRTHARQFANLRLFVLDPHDLVLSKLVRNSEVDAEDVKLLIQSLNLDLDLIKTRYQQELRPYVTGPVERHDQTMDLWLDAAVEERGHSGR